MRKWIALAAIVAAALPLPLAAQNVPAFEVNPQRVRFSGPKNCAPTRTYIVPTVQLYVQARNTSWARNGGAEAKARVFVVGLEKKLLQALAKRIQDDLVAKLRATGNTVITWDEIKGDPDVAALTRRDDNPKYGLPTQSFRAFPGSDFVVTGPSDDQTLGTDFLGGPPIGKFSNLIKAKNATLVMPEIFLSTPILAPVKGGGFTYREAGINTSPALKLASANIWRVPPKLGWCHILVAEHGVRMVSPAVGEIRELGSEEHDWGTWSRTNGDFAFVLDPDQFAAGVLSAGYGINNLIASY